MHRQCWVAIRLGVYPTTRPLVLRWRISATAVTLNPLPIDRNAPPAT